MVAAFQAQRPRPDPRFRAEPHGRRRRRQSRGGSMCWNGARTPTSRAGSTSTGSRTALSAGQAAGAVSRRPVRRGAGGGRLRAEFDAEAGSFAVWAYDTHKLPICPLHYDRILGDDASGAGAAGRRLCGPADWRPHVGAPGARAEGASWPQLAATTPAAARRRGGRRHASTASRATRQLDAARRADPRPALARRRISASPPTTSTTAASSTSTSSPACAWSCRRCSTTPTAWCFELIARRHARRLADRPYRRAARPQGLLRAACARRRRGRSISWSRRSLRAHEQLREDWPVEGTTGYEFANLVGGLLIDPAGEEALHPRLSPSSPASVAPSATSSASASSASWTTRWRAS